MDKEYIKFLADTLATHVSPKRIYLFGSCARGEDHEDSDIDLLIIKDSSLPRYERARGMRKLIKPYKHPLDLIVYTPEEFEREKRVVGTLPYQVIQEGVLLYGGRGRSTSKSLVRQRRRGPHGETPRDR